MKSGETISVVLNHVSFPRSDWHYPLDVQLVEGAARQLDLELQPFGISVEFLHEPGRHIEARGYGDLLNAVRIRSTRSGLGNLCLGHIIGCSADLDLLDDIRRGVKRIAFAPETIEPDGSDKRVCHNCGCGC